MNNWHDRFIKREYLLAGELAKRFNLKNHRLHPEAQNRATEKSLNDLGWIDDIKLSTNGDGPASLDDNPAAVLYDGHERVELAIMKFGPDVPVPVAWYQLSPKETDAAIRNKDAIAALAEIDLGKLAEFPIEMEFQIPEVELSFGFEVEKPEPKDTSPVNLQEQYAILVEFASEQAQLEALENLLNQGYECRALIS